jgi:hypothetical protein
MSDQSDCLEVRSKPAGASEMAGGGPDMSAKMANHVSHAERRGLLQTQTMQLQRVLPRPHLTCAR